MFACCQSSVDAQRWRADYYPAGGYDYGRDGQPSTQLSWPVGPISPCNLAAIWGILNPGQGGHQNEAGQVGAILTWVDANGYPIVDPPPPNSVTLLQMPKASWSCGLFGEGFLLFEATATTNPAGTYVETGDGVTWWSGTCTGRNYVTVTPVLEQVQGQSEYRIHLAPVDLSATIHASLTGYPLTTAHYGTACSYQVLLAPPADCFDFSGYPNPPPAGTTPLASDTATKLANLSDGSGYNTQASYGPNTNSTASLAMQQIVQDGIFYVFGHGGDPYHGIQLSYQTFWNGSQWSYLVQKEALRTFILNNWQGPPPLPDVQVLDSLPASSLANPKLAVFEGCFTARSTPDYGDPMDGAHGRGARNSIGWTGDIFTPFAERWAGQFWKSPQQGSTINQAFSDADAIDHNLAMQARNFWLTNRGNDNILLGGG